MGNSPSECDGATCVCGRDLPPCDDFDDITEGPIKRLVDTPYVYTFFGGRYYRIRGAMVYYCPDCFWKPKRDYIQQQQQQQEQREESQGENFFSWALNNEREEREDIRRRVYKSTTRPFGFQEANASDDIGDSRIFPSGPPNTQETVESGDSMTPTQDNGEITEYVVSVVPDIKPDGCIDTEWLQTVQTHMICNYAQQNGFSLAEEQLLFDLFSCTQTSLSDKERLFLTKTVHKLCFSPASDHPCIPPAFNDCPGKFMSVMLYCGIQLNYTGTKWMQQCLNSLVSAKILDKQLQSMIIEATSKFWSPYDSLRFLHKCSEKEIPDLDQKRILHLTRTHDLRYPEVDKAMEADPCSSLIQNLNGIIDDEPLKALNEVMDELGDTKLVQPETFEQIKKIVTEVYYTILDRHRFDITNPEERSKYLSGDALTRAEYGLKSSNYLDIAGAIATLACGIREHKGFTPRITQLVALTILMLSDKESTSRLLEVMTGEGKSCIIAMFAAALSTQGKHVDIITSSPLLAYRDATEWEGYYQMFHLKSTHNITEMKKQQSSAKKFDADTERLKTYKHNIVYGTVSNFAADVLREEFEQKPIRSEGNWRRRFDAVIADEVDLLMLDEGVQFTYLSHNASILHHMEPVLASVWCVIGQYRPVNTVHGKTLYAGKPDMFANAIFDSISAIDEFKNAHDLLILAQDAELIDEAAVEALLSSNDRSSKQAALSEISIDTVIRFLKLLEPYLFDVFTVNDKGLLTPVLSDKDVSSKDDTLEVKILVLPNGMACTLCTHEELKDGAVAKVQDRLDFSSAPDDEAGDGARKHPPHVKKFMIDQVRLLYQTRRQVEQSPPAPVSPLSSGASVEVPVGTSTVSSASAPPENRTLDSTMHMYPRFGGSSYGDEMYGHMRFQPYGAHGIDSTMPIGPRFGYGHEMYGDERFQPYGNQGPSFGANSYAYGDERFQPSGNQGPSFGGNSYAHEMYGHDSFQPYDSYGNRGPSFGGNRHRDEMHGDEMFQDVNEDVRHGDQNIQRGMIYLMYKAIMIEYPQMEYPQLFWEDRDFHHDLLRFQNLKNQECPNEFKNDPKYKEWLQTAENPEIVADLLIGEDRGYREWRERCRDMYHSHGDVLELMLETNQDPGDKFTMNPKDPMNFIKDPVYQEWLKMIRKQEYRGYYSVHSGGSTRKLKLPPFLEEFVTDQVPTYTESAIKSLQMLENREYAIASDEDGNNGRIIPVDFQNSGVMEMNKKWGGGLQQMLEMKHNLSLSSMSVVTNFMSHVELFSRYKENGGIYGLSGTLGLDSSTTQKVLFELFECDVCCIPTHKRRKLYEKQPIIVHGGDDAWFGEIMKAVNEAVHHDQWEPGQGRAVLLLCEDIKTATELKEHVLSKEGWTEATVTLYAHSNVDEVKSILSRHTFTPGEMVIATNLAGRGTNMKLSPEVEKSGGLFCVMTFLPRNRRVELQAFGRTARKGLTGSVQCILNASSLPLHYRNLDLQSIRELRATEERTRLHELISSDVKEVQLRETLFKQHCKFLGEIYRQLSERDDKVIVIDSLNESWGQWLLMKKEQIERFEKDALTEELRKAQSQWKPSIPQNQTDSLHLPVTNFYHLIKFGNRLLVTDDKGNAERACQYYSSSIEMEPRYAAFAHYNHAYCTIIMEKDGFSYIDQAISDLKKADKCLDPYVSEVTSVLQCVNIVNKIRAELHGGSKDGAKDLTTQMQVRLQVIDFIKKKIKEAIEKLTGFRKDERHVIAEALGVFSLIPEADDLTHQELNSIWKLGMEVVFTVEAKPRFCWDALIVCLLGIAEIIAGVLLAVCTVGAMANFGMALISEGISDCIDGVEGMITGDFSWVEWGVAKAIGIAISLATGGIGRWLGSAAKGLKTGAAIGKRLKSLKAIPKIAKNVSKWGVAAEKNLMSLAKEVGKEVAEQVAMKGVSLAQNSLFDKALEEIEKACREDIMGDLRKAFSEGELGNTVDLLFVQKLPDDRMLPGIRDDARTFFKRVGYNVVSSLLSTSEAQKYMTEVSLSLIDELTGDHKAANVISVASEAITMTATIAAARSSIQTFSKKFIPQADETCLRFLDYIEDSQENQQHVGARKDLKCVVAFKEELAHLMGDVFAEAVTAILKNDRSSMANQELNGNLNQIGQKLFDKHAFRSDKTMEQLKAGQSANYIRFMEATDSSMAKSENSHDDNDGGIVDQYVKRVKDINTPGSVLELRILAEHFGVGVTVYSEEKNGELVSIDPPSGAIRVELLRIPSSDEHPNGHYKLKNSGAETGNCLFTAFACGRNPDLPLSQQREQALAARNKVAEIVGSQPDLWRDHISRRMKIDQLKRRSYGSNTT